MARKKLLIVALLAATPAHAGCFEITFGQEMLHLLSPAPVYQNEVYIPCNVCGHLSGTPHEMPPIVEMLPLVPPYIPPYVPPYEPPFVPPLAANVPETSTWIMLLVGFIGLSRIGARRVLKNSGE